MTHTGNFQSEEHAANFHAASLSTRFGAPERMICGARTLRGGVCKRVPIREGKGRCLRHAGPHAARRYRERQREDFLSGRISAEEWRRAEGRRAANRLREKWKKNPWAPGRTIDLGLAEDDLRDEASARGFDMEALAPSVADWLRWRYRRLVLDAGRAGARWEAVLVEELPHRIRAAGAPPTGYEGSAASALEEASDPLAPGCALWRANACTGAASKRTRPDQPKAPPVVRGKGYARPGRPRSGPASEDELARLMDTYRQHRDIVAPMLARCPTEVHRVVLLRALRDHLNAPQERAAHARWQDMVRLYGRG